MLAIIGLLAIFLFAYVSVPLIFQQQSDDLPNYNDPDVENLEEERDALFRAIQELDLRKDLRPSRREQLRARYEAKAAKILRALDERRAEISGVPVGTKRESRTPFALLGLLGFMLISATLMSNFVLPRIGPDGTVTTFFDEDLEAANALRNLQRAANRDPSEENLLALADAYWQLDEVEKAEETYTRLTELDPAPVIAYRRLGLLTLQTDLDQALSFLERAQELDPGDLDTLYTLAEVYFSQARPDEAVEALESYLRQPTGQDDEEVQVRLEVFKALRPALKEATQTPSEENFAILAEAYWQYEERERAADIYARILANFNAQNATAVSRIGQVFFFNNRLDDAINLLSQAKELEPDNLETLLFLGNAYFSQERFQDAIEVWQDYTELSGGEDQAGRIPELIETARARLNSLETDTGVSSETGAEVSGEQLYVANCAACHGLAGQGGSGPRLAGNRRAGDERNVRNIIQFGRGLMPGFGVNLNEQELNDLTQYVLEVIAVTETSEN